MGQHSPPVNQTEGAVCFGTLRRTAPQGTQLNYSHVSICPSSFRAGVVRDVEWELSTYKAWKPGLLTILRQPLTFSEKS